MVRTRACLSGDLRKLATYLLTVFLANDAGTRNLIRIYTTLIGTIIS